MVKDSDECHCSENKASVENPIRRTMEISPETLNLLRIAKIPSEFIETVRESELPIEEQHPIETKGFPISAEIEVPFRETPMSEIPVMVEGAIPTESWWEEPPESEIEMAIEPAWEEPLWPEQELPTELPEDFSPEEGVETIYLTDMMFDMSGVAHMTPGLQNLVGNTIGGLVSTSNPMFGVPNGGMLYSDSDDYGRTVERVNCKMIVFFKVDILKEGRVILPKARFSDFRPELKLYKGGSLVGYINAKDIKGLPGKLIVEWKRNNQLVKLVKQKKIGQKAEEKDRLEIEAKDLKDLQEQVNEIEKEGWMFLVLPPRSLPKPPETTKEVLEGTIKLIPNKDPKNPCEDSDKLTIIWSAAKTSRVHEGPTTNYSGNNLIQIAQVAKDHTQGGKGFKVFDLELYWEVKNPLECCKTKQPYAVIQFAWARALIKQSGRFRRQVLGHDWTLDILESEKELARNENEYDPRFTNNPRNSRPKKKPDVQPGKTPKAKAAVVQEDSPGISFKHYIGERGDDGKFIPGLLGRGGCVIIDFVAFLVCDNPEFQKGNPAENYKRAKVEKMIQYRLIFSFKGSGSDPNVVPKINKVKEIKCEKQLEYYLKINKLFQRAYSKPPESKLEEKEKYSKENEKTTFKKC